MKRIPEPGEGMSGFIVIVLILLAIYALLMLSGGEQPAQLILLELL